MSHLKNIDRQEAERIKKENMELALSTFKASKPSEHVLTYYEKLPSKYQRRFLDLYNSTTTNKTTAITLKCADCVGFENLEENVGNCKARTCALWWFRPFQKATHD